MMKVTSNITLLIYFYRNDNRFRENNNTVEVSIFSATVPNFFTCRY